MIIRGSSNKEQRELECKKDNKISKQVAIYLWITILLSVSADLIFSGKDKWNNLFLYLILGPISISLICILLFALYHILIKPFFGECK